MTYIGEPIREWEVEETPILPEPQEPEYDPQPEREEEREHEEVPVLVPAE